MAEVARFTCGKCGNSITLCSETKIRLNEGEKSTITCEEAKTVFPSMGGCADSKLILEKNKGDKPVSAKAVRLKSFPDNETAKAVIEARVDQEQMAKSPEAGAKESEDDEAPDPSEKTEDAKPENTDDASSATGDETPSPAKDEEDEDEDEED